MNLIDVDPNDREKEISSLSLPGIDFVHESLVGSQKNIIAKNDGI